MTGQPSNFGFGEDEIMLRDSVRRFFSDHCSADKVHALVAHDSDIHRPIECLWDKDLWRQIVELGWTGVCIPESAGGAGMPLVAAAAVAEEAGRAAFPSPLISTYCAAFTLKACDTEAAVRAMQDISTGTATTLAITNEKGSWEVDDTDVKVSGGRLSGTAWFVQDARKADRFIVSARGEKGVGLYQVEANAANINVVADGIIDLTRDQAHIEFTGADCIELAAQGCGDRALKDAMPSILTVMSADMVGAGEWLLQTTVEYAKTRTQFDRPIGFFQAVKHPLVNVMIEIDLAKSLVYNAACSVDCGEESAEVYARMAKSQANDMAVYSSSRAVQFHGGIGFTWECFVHIFFKRQMHSQVLYGDSKYQRTKLADIMIGKVA